MSRFYEVSDETIDKFYAIWNSKTTPSEVDFAFVGDEKQKVLIKVSKVPDQYSFLLKKTILVRINDEMTSVLDDESIEILFEQEIDKIIVDGNSGKISLASPKLSTFPGIIAKHGIDKVLRANQIEDLSFEQREDMKNDPFEF